MEKNTITLYTCLHTYAGLLFRRGLQVRGLSRRFVVLAGFPFSPVPLKNIPRNAGMERDNQRRSYFALTSGETFVRLSRKDSIESRRQVRRLTHYKWRRNATIIFLSVDIRLRRRTRRISITMEASRLSPLFYAIPEASRRPKETPGEDAFPLNFPIAAGCENLLPSHSRSLTLLKGGDFGPFYFSPISFFGAVWPFKPIAFLSSTSLPGHAGFHQRLSFSPRRRVDESKSD